MAGQYKVGDKVVITKHPSVFKGLVGVIDEVDDLTDWFVVRFPDGGIGGYAEVIEAGETCPFSPDQFVGLA